MSVEADLKLKFQLTLQTKKSSIFFINLFNLINYFHFSYEISVSTKQISLHSFRHG